ncbi:hypothetical protein [Chitinophaga sp. S165]|uniref:hypothetical protein n=1 Tax=Chitinophaga sp. S165 TaxID=2135462 RepID=UPI000D719B18|nr:hypothetical protein [Chitinophaga sp. S165]PWV50575.1 hypothetical protein C7475_104204 [Chitinophaga sp. S165]
MPKFIGVPPFVGTQDNLTIYLMNGEYIVRTKSSLTGKRVKRDPAFAKTMMYAGWLKQASKIASVVYQQMPSDERIYKQYRQLTGKAMSLLKEGFHVADVIIMLEAVYLPQLVNDNSCNGTGYTHTNANTSNNSICTIHNVGRTECECKCVEASYNGNKYKRTSDIKSKRNDKQNRRGNRMYVIDKFSNVNEIANKANKVNKVRYESTQPCYYFGDRPQRAVQAGITGLSCLKYADATDRGLIVQLKPNRPPMPDSKGTSKNYSQ